MDIKLQSTYFNISEQRHKFNNEVNLKKKKAKSINVCSNFFLSFYISDKVHPANFGWW